MIQPIDMTELNFQKEAKIVVEEVSCVEQSLRVLRAKLDEPYLEMELQYDIEILEGAVERLQEALRLREQYILRQLGM